MKYLDFISILIPIILSIITFLYYWPLVIEYFDKQRSISFINSNKHKFFILLILITISICLCYLILCNKSETLSWIGQFIVLIIFYYSIDFKLNTIIRYVKGENIEFETSKSNNDLLEELHINSSEIKESLSEDIKLSTADIIKSSEESIKAIKESMKTHSNDVKDVLSEKIKVSTTDIIKRSQESIEDVIESIHINPADAINDIDKFNSSNGVEFIKPIYNIFREMNKDLFEYHFLNNRLIKTSEDKLLFYNLTCNRIKSDRKINLDIRINENKNILYHKKEIALFLNNFFRIKELIDDDNVKNEEINSFFSSNFTINEGEIDFNINGFTRNLK